MGHSIFDADLGQEIDNMEGIGRGMSRAEGGHRDDDGVRPGPIFSMLQRTRCLLQFTLGE